jgi:hypothetical protein
MIRRLHTALGIALLIGFVYAIANQAQLFPNLAWPSRVSLAFRGCRVPRAGWLSSDCHLPPAVG